MKVFSGLTHKEFFAFITSTSASSILVLWSAHASSLAWLETPDVFNFWQFVFPESRKFETKAFYFGTHILFAIVVLLGSSLSFFLQKKEHREIKILVAQIFVVIYLCWLQSLTIDRAIQAAGFH
jgi:hypothetical protein